MSRVTLLATTFVLATALAVSGCASDGDDGPPAPGPPSGPPIATSPPPSPASPTPSPRPPEVPAPGNHVLALNHAGAEVEYEVHAPAAFRTGKRLPLVVAIHHWGGDVESMRQMTRLDATADREGFLVAYPCCDTAYDVGVIRALVAHLVKAWHVDPDRVYATGMSAGAQTVVELAVEAPGVFAAIAPVSGGFRSSGPAVDAAAKPSRPVSVVSFVGSQDRAARAIGDGVDRWRDQLRCRRAPAAWVDPAKTISRTSARCADGSDVVVYVIEGMGHSWPGGANVALGAPRVKLNATDLIWQFFSAHPRRR